MEQFSSILDLPLQTLAALAAGYLGYRLAYTGLDGSHKTVDVVFFVTTFAFISQISVTLLAFIVGSIFPPNASTIEGIRLKFVALGFLAPKPAIKDAIYPIFGVLSSLVAAAAWRVKLKDRVEKWLDEWKISRSDRSLSAFDQMKQKSQQGLTSMTVIKKDGRALMCEKLFTFDKQRHGPCVFGDDGSVGIYVTSSRAPNDDTWVQENPDEGDWGIQLTIIPAEEVAEIRVSHPAIVSA